MAGSAGDSRGSSISFLPVRNSWGLVGPHPIAFVDVEWPVVRLWEEGETSVIREGRWQLSLLARPASLTSSNLNPQL